MSTTGAFSSLISEIQHGINHSVEHVIDVVADEYMADTDRSGWIEGGGHCAEDYAEVEVMLEQTPLQGRHDIITGVMRAIDDMVKEARS
jgi:hypothetical protein